MTIDEAIKILDPATTREVLHGRDEQEVKELVQEATNKACQVVWDVVINMACHAQRDIQDDCRVLVQEQIQDEWKKPLTWGEVMAHVGWGEAGGYEKMANARPLYLEINLKYSIDKKIAKFKKQIFGPWCRGDDIMRMIQRMINEPKLYCRAIRFWWDEPTEAEMYAAPWE